MKSRVWTTVASRAAVAWRDSPAGDVGDHLATLVEAAEHAQEAGRVGEDAGCARSRLVQEGARHGFPDLAVGVVAVEAEAAVVGGGDFEGDGDLQVEAVGERVRFGVALEELAVQFEVRGDVDGGDRGLAVGLRAAGGPAAEEEPEEAAAHQHRDGDEGEHDETHGGRPATAREGGALHRAARIAPPGAGADHAAPPSPEGQVAPGGRRTEANAGGIKGIIAHPRATSRGGEEETPLRYTVVSASGLPGGGSRA